MLNPTGVPSPAEAWREASEVAGLPPSPRPCLRTPVPCPFPSAVPHLRGSWCQRWDLWVFPTARLCVPVTRRRRFSLGKERTNRGVKWEPAVATGSREETGLWWVPLGRPRWRNGVDPVCLSPWPLLAAVSGSLLTSLQLAPKPGQSPPAVLLGHREKLIRRQGDRHLRSFRSTKTKHGR